MLKRAILPTTFDPGDWDTTMIMTPWEIVVSRLHPVDINTPALTLMATLASRDRDLIRERLNELRPGPLSRGARLMALVDLDEFGSVIAFADDTFPRGTSLEDLFDAANASFAVGLAYSAISREEPALLHMHAARMLAKALRIPGRLQLISLEYEGLKLRLGRGDRQAIQRVMDAAPMSERREKHARYLQALVAMGEGDYRLALNLGLDIEVSLLASALLGEAEPQDIPVYKPQVPRLAAAMRSVDAPVPDDIDMEPMLGYARLLKVAQLLNDPVSAVQAGPMVSSIAMHSADQKVLLGALMLQAAAMGAAVSVAPQEVLRLIRQGLGELTQVKPLALYMRRQLPHALLMLAHLPGMPIDIVELITTVPVWVGNAVRVEGRVFPLPGKTGSELQARLLTGRSAKFHHTERTRYATAWNKLALPGQAVPLGVLVQGLQWLAAGDYDDPDEKAALTQGVAGLVAMARGSELETALARIVPQGNM